MFNDELYARRLLEVIKDRSKIVSVRYNALKELNKIGGYNYDIEIQEIIYWDDELADACFKDAEVWDYSYFTNISEQNFDHSTQDLITRALRSRFRRMQKFQNNLVAYDQFENEKFYIDIANNNIEAVEAHLRRGADVNYRSDLGKTPLYEAVRRGNIYLVLLMLERGANPHIANELKKTPLMEAAENLKFAPPENYHKIARILIEKYNVDVNAKDEDGWTALKYASEKANHLMVELLINKGAK